MKKINTMVAVFFSAALVAPHIYGQESAASVLDRLKQQHPSSGISEVNPTPLPGIYEVVLGKNIAFTDSTGRYFIFGHLFDMEQRRDLTADEQALKGNTDSPDVAKSDRHYGAKVKAEFPRTFLGNAIKTVHGNGAREIAVFSDPDCPYCRRLERELAKVSNVTIYTFLFPLDSIHPNAKAHAMAVWCSPDRAQAWSDAMAGKLDAGVPVAGCKNPINDNLVLGGRLGVLGTPTLISVDGRVLPGAAPASAIESWLGGRK